MKILFICMLVLIVAFGAVFMVTAVAVEPHADNAEILAVLAPGLNPENLTTVPIAKLEGVGDFGDITRDMISDVIDKNR